MIVLLMYLSCHATASFPAILAGQTIQLLYFCTKNKVVVVTSSVNTLRYIIKKSLKQWLSGLVYVRDTYFMKFFPYKMRPLFPGKTRFLLSGNEIYESIKPEN